MDKIAEQIAEISVLAEAKHGIAYLPCFAKRLSAVGALAVIVGPIRT